MPLLDGGNEEHYGNTHVIWLWECNTLGSILEKQGGRE
ncbi:hypothetical protein CsSME_00041608 [Camellia sinensis var. sinensis]